MKEKDEELDEERVLRTQNLLKSGKRLPLFANPLIRSPFIFDEPRQIRPGEKDSNLLINLTFASYSWESSVLFLKVGKRLALDARKSCQVTGIPNSQTCKCGTSLELSGGIPDSLMSVPLSKFGRIFDLLPEMIFVLGPKNEILDHNPAASDATGFEQKNLTGLAFSRFLADGDRDAFLRTLESELPSGPFHVRMQKADHSQIDVMMEIKSLPSNDRVLHVVIARDVTEEKKKDLDFLRFSNVIEHTINPIQITDAKGVMVYVNPAFEKTTGYTRAELIGKNPNILSSGKHTKEFWMAVWNQILSGKVWVGQVENQRKDGSSFYTELVISPIVDPSGSVVGFLGAHRDITEQKVLERQLVRSQKMESIGTLAAGIAHEVGNPLTSISSLVQVIQRTTEDQFAKDKLEMIKNQINRIARIIRDLVDFSRPSSYIVKETDINEVLRDALNIVQYGKKVKNIIFEVKLSDRLPKLHVVPDQLVQVFINILMNAVDALEGKPGSITLEAHQRGSMLEIRISDTGKGIEPGEAEKIFEPFYTTKETGQGTGLGLWVSYGIVKNFGGEILLESEPGKGSTFFVQLPIQGA